MTISPVGQSPSSVLAAVEHQHAIAARTLQTANATAQAALTLLADAVDFSQQSATTHHPNTHLDELA